MNTLLYIVGGLLVGFIALMVLTRVMIAVNIRKHKGQPAPELSGTAAKLVRPGKRALFYFFSPSCAACKTMTPQIQEMGKRNRQVMAVDISQDMATARKFGVMATPTTVLVTDGVVQDILIGPQPKSALEGMLG